MEPGVNVGRRYIPGISKSLVPVLFGETVVLCCFVLLVQSQY